MPGVVCLLNVALLSSAVDDGNSRCRVTEAITEKLSFALNAFDRAWKQTLEVALPVSPMEGR